MDSHNELQKLAQQLLQKHRAVRAKRLNKHRKSPAYKVGDYVLVKRTRFPGMKTTPLSDPWVGPYKVISISPNAVNIFAGPKKGGNIQVDHSKLKHWPDGTEEMEVWEDLADSEAAHLDEKAALEKYPEMELDIQSHEVEVGGASNCYKVKRIISGRYSRGWMFLVEWDGYSIDEATWEPLESFINKGILNKKFVSFCKKHKFGEALKVAYSKQKVQRDENNRDSDGKDFPELMDLEEDIPVSAEGS